VFGKHQWSGRGGQLLLELQDRAVGDRVSSEELPWQPAPTQVPVSLGTLDLARHTITNAVERSQQGSIIHGERGTEQPARGTWHDQPADRQA